MQGFGADDCGLPDLEVNVTGRSGQDSVGFGDDVHDFEGADGGALGRFEIHNIKASSGLIIGRSLRRLARMPTSESA